MTARGWAAAAAATIMIAGGCGGVSDKTYTKLEQQREDVLTWARELSAVAETTLAASSEDAIESYDGVDLAGFSDKYASYKYDIQTAFTTEQEEPLTALSADLGPYDPTLTTSNALRLMHGDLTAYFRTYPKGPGKVGLFVEGVPIEISQEEMYDWEGYVNGEPVDLS